jgi:hypothetical protein
MVRLLNKEEELSLMGNLFDLMCENMTEVAPTGLTCEWEKAKWLAEVIPALKKAPRQIALLYCKGMLVGFCMYYVNAGVFMVEELQIKREFRSSNMIVELWKFFKQTVSEETVYMEAYTDLENAYSAKLLQRLGLELVEMTAGGRLKHFRGEFDKIRNR